MAEVPSDRRTLAARCKTGDRVVSEALRRWLPLHRKDSLHPGNLAAIEKSDGSELEWGVRVD